MLTLVLGLQASACSEGDEPGAHAAPATVTNPTDESELTLVTLTEEAEARLDIQTGVVASTERMAVRHVGGEVIIPPGRVITLSAPVAGLIRALTNVTPGAAVHEGQDLFRLVPLAPVDRDTRARASREVEAARANLAAAEARLARTQALAAGRAGSQRAIEEATAANDIAHADLQAAQARSRAVRSSPLLSDVSLRVQAPAEGILRAVSVAAGQSVAAGAPLVEIVASRELWVRVPVGSGDVRRLSPSAVARLGSLSSDEATSVEARPIPGPPTAAPLSGTVDRYYALDASSATFAPGERVIVALPLSESVSTTVVPFSAIFYDPSGTAWLYTCEQEHAFRRSRVDVLRRDGDDAVLARGPDVDTCVVAVGAAELYGSEFEPGH